MAVPGIDPGIVPAIRAVGDRAPESSSRKSSGAERRPSFDGLWRRGDPAIVGLCPWPLDRHAWLAMTIFVPFRISPAITIAHLALKVATHTDSGRPGSAIAVGLSLGFTIPWISDLRKTRSTGLLERSTASLRLARASEASFPKTRPG